MHDARNNRKSAFTPHFTVKTSDAVHVIQKELFVLGLYYYNDHCLESYYIVREVST